MILFYLQAATDDLGRLKLEMTEVEKQEKEWKQKEAELKNKEKVCVILLKVGWSGYYVVPNAGKMNNEIETCWIVLSILIQIHGTKNVGGYHVK